MYQEFDFAIPQVNVRAMPPGYKIPVAMIMQQNSSLGEILGWISRWVFMEGSGYSREQTLKQAKFLFPDLCQTLGSIWNVGLQFQ